jgi:tRNA pseudouridine13 synthase
VLTFTPSPDRFVVEEIPAYTPSGEGPHTFLWIEKRGLTTFDAIARIAAELGVAGRDIGYAGLKDKQATTRQWLSINMETAADPARPMPPLPHVFGPDLTLLAAARHPNKLRMGHLHGNRFEVVLTGSAGDDEVAALRARFADAAANGVPNFYGGQRFGADAANAARGLALLRGERHERDKRKRKLMMSALQSAVFNRALELRATRGALTRVIPGDVLKKTDTGGLFVSTELEVDQRRVDAGELIPTAPLPGGREIEPPPGTAAHALEEEAITAVGATRADFMRLGRDLPGARRPVLLRLADAKFSEEPTDQSTLSEPPEQRAVRLFFTLPAGGYATVVVASVTGPTA